MPFQMITVILIGYVYDLFGRRYTIFANLMLQVMCFMLIPLGAPNVYPIVQIMRTTQLVTNACTVVHPLINDYVKSESRGKANALQVIGQSTGDLLNFTVILSLLNGVEVGTQFQISGLIVLAFSLILLFMIEEPVKRDQKSKSSLTDNKVSLLNGSTQQSTDTIIQIQLDNGCDSLNVKLIHRCSLHQKSTQ
eukprot:403352284